MTQNQAGTLTDTRPGIQRIEVDPKRSESPTFEGRSFGSVGQYEKLRGTAYGELDPTDPRNAVITDIALAPVNERAWWNTPPTSSSSNPLTWIWATAALSWISITGAACG